MVKSRQKLFLPDQTSGQKVEGVERGGKLFTREGQTVSACSIEQNAETKFSSSLFEFFGGSAKSEKWRRKFC